MEQFSLEKWLIDKSRKVVTRDERPVRILDYNVKGDKHICIAVDDEIQESITTVDEDGHCLRDKTGWHESNFDLFFADEEEELTELQKTLEEDCDCYVNLYNDGKTREELREWIKGWCPRIIDLARKELEANYYTKVLDDRMVFKSGLHATDLQKAYDMGKQDALKDLPKWKKMPNGIQGNGDFNPTYLVRVSNGYHFTTPCLSWDKDSMYIELSELEKLPKEE